MLKGQCDIDRCSCFMIQLMLFPPDHHISYFETEVKSNIPAPRSLQHPSRTPSYFLPTVSLDPRSSADSDNKGIVGDVTDTCNLIQSFAVHMALLEQDRGSGSHCGRFYPIRCGTETPLRLPHFSVGGDVASGITALLVSKKGRNTW